MWSHSIFKLEVIDEEFAKNLQKYAKITGIFLIILGLIGIIFPYFASFGTLAFVTYLMLLAGFGIAYLTWTSNKKDWLGWIKSILLIGVALYMIFYPLNGIAMIGLLFSIYFFMDSFSSFVLGVDAIDKKHKWIWFLNSFISLLLAVIFLIGWPFTSLWLVGLFVGISLLFDGIALLIGSKVFLNKEN